MSGFSERAFSNAKTLRDKQRVIPRQVRVPLPKLLDKISGWQIYWHCGANKAGILEVDFVARAPQSTPPLPYRPEVMQIFGRVCDHIESVPRFMGGSSGGRDRIYRLTAQKLSIEPLLFEVTSTCGCDPWLDPSASREVYQCLCEWLKLGNQTGK